MSSSASFRRLTALLLVSLVLLQAFIPSMLVLAVRPGTGAGAKKNATAVLMNMLSNFGIGPDSPLSSVSQSLEVLQKFSELATSLDSSSLHMHINYLLRTLIDSLLEAIQKVSALPPQDNFSSKTLQSVLSSFFSLVDRKIAAKEGFPPALVVFLRNNSAQLTTVVLALYGQVELSFPIKNSWVTSGSAFLFLYKNRDFVDKETVELMLQVPTQMNESLESFLSTFVDNGYLDMMASFMNVMAAQQTQKPAAPQNERVEL